MMGEHRFFYCALMLCANTMKVLDSEGFSGHYIAYSTNTYTMALLCDRYWL